MANKNAKLFIQGVSGGIVNILGGGYSCPILMELEFSRQIF